MASKSSITWRGRFQTLKLHAFGIDQKVKYEAELELYQARNSPSVWACRPTFSHGAHKWEAATVEDLKALIEADFESCLEPWQAYELVPFRERRQMGAAGKMPARRKVG